LYHTTSSRGRSEALGFELEILEMEGMVSCEMIKISEMLKMKNIRPWTGEASGVRCQASVIKQQQNLPG
jgi:hypothetical protein